MGEEPRVMKTPQQWREVLTPFEFAVLREGATERPYTGEYDRTFEPGTYACRACGTELFTSETKFASHCGWPSFFAPAAEDRVRYLTDESLPGVRASRCAAQRATATSGTSSRARGTRPPPTCGTASTRCVWSISRGVDT